MLGNLSNKVIIAALIYRYVVKITSYKTHAEHRTAMILQPTLGRVSGLGTSKAVNFTESRLPLGLHAYL